MCLLCLCLILAGVPRTAEEEREEGAERHTTLVIVTATEVGVRCGRTVGLRGGWAVRCLTGVVGGVTRGLLRRAAERDSSQVAGRGGALADTRLGRGCVRARRLSI